MDVSVIHLFVLGTTLYWVGNRDREGQRNRNKSPLVEGTGTSFGPV